MASLVVMLGLAVGVPAGAVAGGLVGTLYLDWLDKHVPDWYMRPWWRCWWPRG